MRFEGNGGYFLLLEGNAHDNRSFAQLRKEAVVVPAAVAETIIVSVERDHGNHNGVDFLRCNTAKSLPLSPSLAKLRSGCERNALQARSIWLRETRKNSMRVRDLVETVRASEASEASLTMQGKHTCQPRANAASANAERLTSLFMAEYTPTTKAPQVRVSSQAKGMFSARRSSR